MIYHKFVTYRDMSIDILVLGRSKNADSAVKLMGKSEFNFKICIKKLIPNEMKKFLLLKQVFFVILNMGP